MTFEEALRLLVDTHTDRHDEAGYVVHLAACPPRWTVDEYTKAWGVVREHVYPHERKGVSE